MQSERSTAKPSDGCSHFVLQLEMHRKNLLSFLVPDLGSFGFGGYGFFPDLFIGGTNKFK